MKCSFLVPRRTEENSSKLKCSISDSVPGEGYDCWSLIHCIIDVEVECYQEENSTIKRKFPSLLFQTFESTDIKIFFFYNLWEYITIPGNWEYPIENWREKMNSKTIVDHGNRQKIWSCKGLVGSIFIKLKYPLDLYP